jgi:predicted nucleotidyltransferase
MRAKLQIFSYLCDMGTIAAMTTQETYIRRLRKFAAEHGAEYGISRIGIFGSVARGDNTTQSDIDVLVEAPVMGLLTLVSIKNRLEELFDRPVDVVRKTDYMSPRFKTRLEKEVIYA